MVDGGGLLSSRGGLSHTGSSLIVSVWCPGRCGEGWEPGRRPREMVVVLPWWMAAWVASTSRDAVLGEGLNGVVL
jgi:hypothetical protein